MTADLKYMQFRMAHATLDYDTKDDLYRDDVININKAFLEAQIFETLCPGMVNRPTDVIKCIKQNYTDTCGNSATLSVQTYFANLFIGMSCMKRDSLDMDLVAYAVENTDNDIKTEMETTYLDHLCPLPRDSRSQMRGLQALQKHAAISEKKVVNTLELIQRNTNRALSAVPGYQALEYSSPTALSITTPTLAGQVHKWLAGAIVTDDIVNAT